MLAGNTLYALAVALFVLPNGLITGGTTGLGLAAQYFFGLPLSAFVGVFNAVMFLAGLLVLFTFLPPDHILFLDLSGARTWATIPC